MYLHVKRLLTTKVVGLTQLHGAVVGPVEEILPWIHVVNDIRVRLQLRWQTFEVHGSRLVGRRVRETSQRVIKHTRQLTTKSAAIHEEEAVVRLGLREGIGKCEHGVLRIGADGLVRGLGGSRGGREELCRPRIGGRNAVHLRLAHVEAGRGRREGPVIVQFAWRAAKGAAVRKQLEILGFHGRIGEREGHGLWVRGHLLGGGTGTGGGSRELGHLLGSGRGNVMALRRSPGGASLGSGTLGNAAVVLGSHVLPLVSLLHVLLAVALSLGLVGARREQALVHHGSVAVLVVVVTLSLLLGWEAQLMVLAGGLGTLERARVGLLVFTVVGQHLR